MAELGPGSVSCSAEFNLTSCIHSDGAEQRDPVATASTEADEAFMRAHIRFLVVMRLVRQLSDSKLWKMPARHLFCSSAGL